MGGSSVANITAGINDPGYAISPPTDLIDEFPNGTHILTRLNLMLGAETYTRSAIAGSGTNSLSITVQSPVSLLLTDPASRRFGTDPTTGLGVNTIPNARIADNSFSDPDGTAEVEDARQIIVGSPEDVDGQISGLGDGVLDGSYSIDVVGTATGTYRLQITSVDTSGNGKTRVIRGKTNLGKHERLTVTRSGAPGAPILISSSSVPIRTPGDIDLNGQVDLDDIAEITNSIGLNADGPDDPRDIDRDGKITALDARQAVLLCTHPRCAR